MASPDLFRRLWIVWALVVLALLALAYGTPAESTAWYAPLARELRSAIETARQHVGEGAGGP